MFGQGKRFSNFLEYWLKVHYLPLKDELFQQVHKFTCRCQRQRYFDDVLLLKLMKMLFINYLKCFSFHDVLHGEASVVKYYKVSKKSQKI